MERLRGGDEIHGCIPQITGLRRADPVLNSRIARGVLDLVRAGIRRDDALEMPRQPDGGLARTRARVPHVIARRRDL